VRNLGNIFRNRTKRNERAPDWTGDFTLDEEFLNSLLAKCKNKEVRVNIAGWDKEGKSGTYMNAKLSLPLERSKTAVDDGSSDIPF
jgi:hypothetical protein